MFSKADMDQGLPLVLSCFVWVVPQAKGKGVAMCHPTVPTAWPIKEPGLIIRVTPHALRGYGAALCPGVKASVSIEYVYWSGFRLCSSWPQVMVVECAPTIKRMRLRNSTMASLPEIRSSNTYQMSLKQGSLEFGSDSRKLHYCWG